MRLSVIRRLIMPQKELKAEQLQHEEGGKRCVWKKWKQKRLEKILREHDGFISDLSDLTAGEAPSVFFWLFGRWYGRMLCREPQERALKRSIRWRSVINPVLKGFSPLFMKAEQVMEDRNVLLGIPGKDRGIVLPPEPAVWIANHAFKDDTAASIRAAKRHVFTVFGSLPMFYNTFDGISAALNGVVLVNRKCRKSTASTVEKSGKVMACGADILIFPEGVWNKTPEKLLLELWPGAYRTARESGGKIIPIVHYVEDAAYRTPHNRIHTVVDDPVSVEGLMEKEALGKLRDIMAGWYWLMMERYGKSTRSAELSGYADAKDAWEDHLRRRVGMCARYDREIELRGDYRPKDAVRPEEVWKSIAQIEKVTGDNAFHIACACVDVRERREQDFQRRC